MTFNPNAPSNSSSPGVFPAQNRANMARIKAIINADHFFNDTPAINPPGTDGAHKKVTFVNLNPDPTVLPDGTNAILFTKVDALSRTQLWFWNGTVTKQITPQDELGPYIETGTLTIAATTSVTIYPDPGVRYSGAGYVYLNNVTPVSYNYYAILHTAGSLTSKLSGTLIGTEPTLGFSGSNLQARNNTNAPASISYSLILNRAP